MQRCYEKNHGLKNSKISTSSSRHIKKYLSCASQVLLPTLPTLRLIDLQFFLIAKLTIDDDLILDFRVYPSTAWSRYANNSTHRGEKKRDQVLSISECSTRGSYHIHTRCSKMTDKLNNIRMPAHKHGSWNIISYKSTSRKQLRTWVSATHATLRWGHCTAVWALGNIAGDLLMYG